VTPKGVAAYGGQSDALKSSNPSGPQLGLPRARGWLGRPTDEIRPELRSHRVADETEASAAMSLPDQLPRIGAPARRLSTAGVVTRRHLRCRRGEPVAVD
jgi:hypothetical protein